MSHDKQKHWRAVTDALDLKISGDGQAYRPCPIHGGDSPTAFSVGQGDTDWPLLTCHTRCQDSRLSSGDPARQAWYAKAREKLVKLDPQLADHLAPAKGQGKLSVRPSGRPTPSDRSARRGCPEPIQLPLSYVPVETWLGWHDALCGAHRDKMAYLTEERGLSEDTISGACIGWDATARRYTIPVFDLEDGRCLNVRRYSSTAGDKMLNLKGYGRNRLYVPSETLNPTQRVVMCAGEWDALLAGQHGWQTATWTGGEGSVSHVDSHRFTGCDVIIVYDNDETGRAGAQKTAQALARIARSVAVADLGEFGVAEKGDVSDLLRGGGSLQEVVAAATPWVGEVADGLFQRITARQLSEPVPAMEWTATGLLVDPTYGVLAGEQKTLKTYLALFIAVGLASGTEVLGEFAVPHARPVHMYVGEGGRGPFQRRLQRITEALDVDLAALPLSVSFETAPLLSEPFRASLARDLEDLGPRTFFIVDPLYAFHGSDVEAGNLYKRGAMLNSFSGPLSEAGASGLIVDHFTKTGSGTDLNRIQQSGIQQWADSWFLTQHRQPPDVEAGEYRLRLDVGSRQWGGGLWEVDFDLGRFDAELGEYDGDLTVQVRRGNPAALAEAKQRRADSVQASIEEAALRTLRDRPRLSQAKLRKAIRDRLQAQEVRAGTGAIFDGIKQMVASGTLRQDEAGKGFAYSVSDVWLASQGLKDDDK